VFHSHSVDFYNLEDPIAALTEALSHYATITLGDTIVFESDDEKDIYLDVLSLKPENHVSLVQGIGHAFEFKVCL
jgi:hypothetical protein